jgi:hypothetical protein
LRKQTPQRKTEKPERNEEESDEKEEKKEDDEDFKIVAVVKGTKKRGRPSKKDLELKKQAENLKQAQAAYLKAQAEAGIKPAGSKKK